MEPSQFSNTSSVLGLSANQLVISSNQTEIDVRCGHFWYVTNDKQPVISADIIMVKFIAYQILLRLIAIFGLVGNIINLVVLRSFKGRAFFYLFWLAVSDLCTMLLDNVTVVRLNSAPQSYIDAFLFCHVLSCSTGAFLTTSTFIVVVLTVERFLAVWRPIESRGGLGSPRPWYIVLMCFVFGAIVFAPTSLTRQLETVVYSGLENADNTIACHVCTASAYQHSSSGRIYITVREVVGRVIPLIMVVTLNVAIVAALNRHQRQRSSLNKTTDPSNDQSTEDNLRAALITIMVFFVICMTPVVIKNLFRDIFYSNNMASEIFRAVAVLLLQFNTACNFYVYCFCSRAIRQRLFELCRKVFPARTAHLDLVTDKTPNDSGSSGTTTVSMNSLNSVRSTS